jgi:hypothetical protein
MARGTVFSYKGQQVDPRKAGRGLKVEAVVAGRVTERADTLIVEADLVRVADGSELWGESYNRKASDILAVQEDIANEISQKLRLRLTAEDKNRLNRHSTENAEAYQLYLKGRYFLAKFTKEDLEKGLGYFNQAVALDPNYPLAYDGLSMYYEYNEDAFLSPRQATPKAKEAARKALALDDSLPEAHTELANVYFWYDWDWVNAEHEYRRAVGLNPNYASAHEFYGWYLAWGGKMKASRRVNTPWTLIRCRPRCIGLRDWPSTARGGTMRPSGSCANLPTWTQTTGWASLPWLLPLNRRATSLRPSRTFRRLRWWLGTTLCRSGNSDVPTPSRESRATPRGSFWA